MKFQTEWLPVEGTVPEFLENLRAKFEAYAAHNYEVQLSNRVHRCKERAFAIDPLVRDDCPKEFKSTGLEVVDFASAIFSKRKHDLTCAFPESHNCEVHHITFSPKFITVDKLESMGHKRTTTKTQTEVRVLCCCSSICMFLSALIIFFRSST